MNPVPYYHCLHTWKCTHAMQPLKIKNLNRGQMFHDLSSIISSLTDLNVKLFCMIYSCLDLNDTIWLLHHGNVHGYYNVE